MSTKKIKSNVRLQEQLILDQQIAGRVPYVDSNKELKSSTVTQADLEQLAGKIVLTTDDLGQPNGVASLNASGKLDFDQVPAIAIVDTFVVADIAARDALVIGPNDGEVQQGDVAVVLDASADPAVDVGGASYIYTGTAWQRLISPTDAVQSVNGQTGIVVLDTDDIAEGATNLYFTEERAQDAVGTILTDTASVDLAYDDALNTISATVLPAGVDHDQLLNFVANEHVDHSLVEIATAPNSGLTGGGDITATRNLSVDITGTTALGVAPDLADEVLIQDVSGSVLRKVTVGQILSNVDVGSAGDIEETSFSLANNQAVAADVTGFLFGSGVRSFDALVSVEIDATAPLFESFKLHGIRKGSSFEMTVEAVGDDSLVVFTITSGGQIQYTSGTYAGFVSGAIKFRAITTTV